MSQRSRSFSPQVQAKLAGDTCVRRFAERASIDESLSVGFTLCSEVKPAAKARRNRHFIDEVKKVCPTAMVVQANELFSLAVSGPVLRLLLASPLVSSVQHVAGEPKDLTKVRPAIVAPQLGATA